MEFNVFKFDDYDWYISKLSLQDTLDWYNNEYREEIKIDDEYIKVCDLDKEGMWRETKDEMDIARLRDYDETSVGNELGFGDLKRRGGIIFKFVSFRDVIEKYYSDKELEEPEVIASTDC